VGISVFTEGKIIRNSGFNYTDVMFPIFRTEPLMERWYMWQSSILFTKMI